MVASYISQHLSLSCLIFAIISVSTVLHLLQAHWWKTKPAIPNTLTTVEVWNGNFFYLAALSPLIKEGCQRFCICWRHMGGVREQLNNP